jgi:hypothetical protein
VVWRCCAEAGLQGVLRCCACVLRCALVVLCQQHARGVRWLCTVLLVMPRWGMALAACHTHTHTHTSHVCNASGRALSVAAAARSQSGLRPAVLMLRVPCGAYGGLRPEARSA